MTSSASPVPASTRVGPQEPSALAPASISAVASPPSPLFQWCMGFDCFADQKIQVAILLLDPDRSPAIAAACAAFPAVGPCQMIAAGLCKPDTAQTVLQEALNCLGIEKTEPTLGFGPPGKTAEAALAGWAQAVSRSWAAIEELDAEGPGHRWRAWATDFGDGRTVESMFPRHTISSQEGREASAKKMACAVLSVLRERAEAVLGKGVVLDSRIVEYGLHLHDDTDRQNEGWARAVAERRTLRKSASGKSCVDDSAEKNGADLAMLRAESSKPMRL